MFSSYLHIIYDFIIQFNHLSYIDSKEITLKIRDGVQDVFFQTYL